MNEQKLTIKRMANELYALADDQETHVYHPHEMLVTFLRNMGNTLMAVLDQLTDDTTNSKKAATEVAKDLDEFAHDLIKGMCMSEPDIAEQLLTYAKTLTDATYDDERAARDARKNSNAEAQSGREAESAATPTTDAERLKRYHTVRYTGIEFQRYFSPHFVRLVGSFVNPTGDKNNNHVYELLVKESASHPGRWIARGTNDGRELFTLTCASKWGAERYGFGALRSYLLRHLRRTIKANKAKEGK
jgi:hypothetical protein